MQTMGTDIFMLNNETILCTVDHYSNFPIMMKVDNLSADDLVQMANLIFAESWAPYKLFQMQA